MPGQATPLSSSRERSRERGYWTLGPAGSTSTRCPFSEPSPPGDGISSGTPFRSDRDACDDELSPGLGRNGAAAAAAAAPFTHAAPPSDLPKLKSFPGLKALLGDCERSRELLPDDDEVDEDEDVDEDDAAVLAAACAAPKTAAPSFLFSGDLRNLKLRNPGSLASLPVGD